MDADSHRKRPARCYDTRCRFDQAKPRTHGTLSIVFVGEWETEIDEQAVAQVLGDMAFVTRHDLGARGLILLHQLAVILGVELLG